jgi:hypothetical protein
MSETLYRCTHPKCTVRCTTKSKGKKHSAKTGHSMTVNSRATIAHAKHKARQNPTYLERLAEMDHRLNGDQA